MSLQKCNRVHKRTEVELKETPKLILSQELLKQINILHQESPQNTEWSGVLLYKIKEGTLQDLKNLVIDVDSVIPMDIGTGAATEYDYNPEDEYLMEAMEKAFTSGYKLGHIHTHHSMKAYFSGVDTSELHDNTGNHAYYLSLIVNYKTPDEWVAKIAINGEVVTKGTHKVTKDLTSTATWTAGDSPDSFTIIEEENKDEEVNETTPVMFTIKCDIETEADAFSERVFKLKEEREKKFKKRPSFPEWKRSGLGFSTYGSPLLSEPNQTSLFEDTPESDYKDFYGKFTENAVIDFLKELLISEVPALKDLTNLDEMFQVIDASLDDTAIEELAGEVDSVLERQADDFFKTQLFNQPLALTALIERISNLLEKGKFEKAFGRELSFYLNSPVSEEDLKIIAKLKGETWEPMIML